MRTLRTVPELRAHLAAARAAGRTIGLVPTMGAFHAGHAALMRTGRAGCDELVVSLFVNPAQFDAADDLAAYPRSEASDATVARELGVDVLFAPDVGAIYPDGFATRVDVARLGGVLEGAQRGSGHFAAVCTVVCKLFNLVGPDVAWFGQKDAQQVAVIARMVRDLDIPVRIEVVPTVREADGLALSSRNVRLAPADRERARALHAGLRASADVVAAGSADPAAAEAAGRAALAAHGVAPDYFALVDPETLAPVPDLAGRVLVAVAARVGPVRLIDNLVLECEPAATLA